MQMLIQNGQVSPVLTALMEAVGLHVEDRSPAGVNEILQREWVKAKEGVIRAKLGGRFPNEQELGLLQEIGGREIPIDPSRGYDGSIVLGATLKAVLRRLWFVASEKFRLGGLCPDVGFVRPIFLLGSLRPLDQGLEGRDKLGEIMSEVGVLHFDSPMGESWPRNEIEAMVTIANGLNITGIIPVGVSDVEVAGKTRPANTAETISRFYQHERRRGHYLLVASQPFCVNQLLATRRAVKDFTGITFDVCGPSAPPLPLARWLDNLAKQLWEECQLLPK